MRDHLRDDLQQGDVVQEITGNKMRRDHLLLWLWAAITAAVMVTAAVPIDAQAQLWLADSLLVVMLVVRRLATHDAGRPRLKQWLRVLLLFLGAYLTARYFFWRTFSTLSYYVFASYCAALALYAAEVYGIAFFFLGLFVIAQPLWREPVPLPDDQTRWPSVDVLIPAYDEDPDLQQVTLLSETQIHYPNNTLRIYLLDD